ncbi:MAG: hypothetical protein F6K41_28625 [Symploca sp. SIO3E6]|nr:hypothetical protein [Caldora sp. SIO3E6]
MHESPSRPVPTSPRLFQVRRQEAVLMKKVSPSCMKIPLDPSPRPRVSASLSRHKAPREESLYDKRFKLFSRFGLFPGPLH